jgi:heme/copper-type cytochrome/quinol oxidase subunit 3
VFLICETRHLFFQRRSFKLMSEGSYSALLLMALLFSVKALVEYGANLVSDFNPGASCFWERSFYYCFGVHRLYPAKNLTPLHYSSMRKRVWALKSKCAMLLLHMTLPIWPSICRGSRCRGSIREPGRLHRALVI